MKVVFCVVALFVLAAAVQEKENGLFDSAVLSDIIPKEYEDLYDYETNFESSDGNVFDTETVDKFDNGIQELPINDNVIKDYQFEDNRFNDTDKNITSKITTEYIKHSDKTLKEKVGQNVQNTKSINNFEIKKTRESNIHNDSGNIDDTLFEELLVDSVERKGTMMDLSGEFEELFKTLDSINYDDSESKDDILEYEEENDRPYKEGNILSFRGNENFEDELVNILSEEVVDDTYQNSMDRSKNTDELHLSKKNIKNYDKYDDVFEDRIEKFLNHSYGNDGLVNDHMPINEDAEIFSTTEAAATVASPALENASESAHTSRTYLANDAPSFSATEPPLSSTSQADSSSASELAPSSSSELSSSSASELPYSLASEVTSSSASKAQYSSTSGASSFLTNRAPSSLASELPSSLASEVTSSSASIAPYSLTSGAPSALRNEAPFSLTSDVSLSVIETISASASGAPYFAATGAPPSLESEIASTSASEATSDDQNNSQYNQVMSLFVSQHSEDLGTNSEKFLKNLAPIHIKLSVDEPTVITSPEYPNPYPTNNVVDWILEGPGMGIELNITDFQVNGALGDYLLIKPGGIDETGTEGLVFSFRLTSERKYRFLNVNRMFVRFEAKMGMQFFKGFSLSVKMIWPPRDVEAQELEPEPIKKDPAETLTVSLAGLSMPHFYEIIPTFKSLVADMAEEYIVDNNIDLGLNTTSEVTQITRTAVCDIRWPNYETCVDVTFGVPLQYDDESLPPRLSSKDLDLMWSTYIGKEPYASRFREMGVMEYDIPAESAALMMWVAVALGVIISISMLFFVVWRFRCLEDYTRMKSYIDVGTENSGKKYSELYPTPHQSLPPLPNDLDYSWSQKLSFGNTSNNAYSNRSFEQDGSMFDMESDNEDKVHDRSRISDMVGHERKENQGNIDIVISKALY